METPGQPYTSTRWLVKEGNEQDFIVRWTTFTQWSLKNASGAKSFVLIQDRVEPRKFLSFGVWESAQALKEWRRRPEVAALYRECWALCEEFEPSDYTLAASPTR